jgi:hypothetical protein
MSPEMTTALWYEADWRPLSEVQVGDLIHPGKGANVRQLQAFAVQRVERVRRLASSGSVEVELADGSTTSARSAARFWIVRAS